MNKTDDSMTEEQREYMAAQCEAAGWNDMAARWRGEPWPPRATGQGHGAQADAGTDPAMEEVA